MTEYKFVLSTRTVPVGTVVFKIVNKGDVQHNMVFPGPIVYGKSPLLATGQTYSLKMRFKSAGSYPFVCTLHIELGMTATLRVKK
jgi:plastocyanin